MNPVRRIFRIRFASLHADTYRDLFVLVGTSLDYVRKSNHFSLRATGQACFITQRFQLSLYLIDVIGHIGKGYATGVGLSGMAMNRLSSSRLTPSSPLYSPLSPFRM